MSSISAPPVDTPSALEERRAALLAEAVARHLTKTEAGHCVRVNFFERREAEAVCARLRALPADGLSSHLHTYVLVSPDSDKSSSLDTTADRAIEHRNRKSGQLCLFVPSDLVDAAISSLGNPFAELDGRVLYRHVLTQVVDELGLVARDLVKQVRSEVAIGARASGGELLDLAIEAKERERAGRLDDLGLELWRVGLIADARSDFNIHLADNRRHARLLARPARLDAPARDRIASLRVSSKTARELERFFARRTMHDTRSWSQALIAEELTYDRWVFPESVETDLQGVQVKPFLDARGLLVKTARGLRQDNVPGSPLFAPIGEKGAIKVDWVTEPLNPVNVHAWSVSLVPARSPDLDGDTDGLPDLPSREVKGNHRTTRLKLDLDLDEPPEVPFLVRVVALDESGNEVQDSSREPFDSESNDFFLSLGPTPQSGIVSRRQTVPSLAEGRLGAAVEARTQTIELSELSWPEAKSATYFSARVDPRTLLTLAFSPFLLEVERRTLREPRTGARLALAVNEILPAGIDAILAAPPILEEAGAWGEFWRTRKVLFDRIKSDEARDVIEAADWTPEVINAALRYANAYGDLLNSIPADDAEGLRAALTVDTLLLSFDTGSEPEDAVVVLPTHPLRVAWFASHTALLGNWERSLLNRPRSERSKLLDRELVRDLRPVNMPAFTVSWRNGRPFVFFQNLAFAHGVALPGNAPDPVRRYLEIAQVLGLGEEKQEADDRGPERLGRHVQRFLEIHPYADPLQLALVNPDGGEFLAEALEQALGESAPTDEDAEPPATPAIDITAYVLEERQGGLNGLDRLRSPQNERRTRLPSDHLRPALAATVRRYERIAAGDMKHQSCYHAHVAVVSDMSQPRIVAAPLLIGEATPRSLSLFGLIARFIGEFGTDGQDIVWRYRVVTTNAGRLDGHPAGPRFGEAMVELQAAILDATGRLLDSTSASGSEPVLEVRLGEERRDVLERLHEGADWVVTVDRFFGVDYYDSPNLPQLATCARKHLIDYSPEFVEGLGHRMIVTTASREEITSILRRAMEDLGFSAIDRSVSHLLYYLKTVSGRLALQALRPTTGGAAAVSLGAVMAYLQKKHRLVNAVVVPVDVHLELFSPAGRGPIAEGERRCDLILVGTRRGIVDMTFVEVKWRRGLLAGMEELVDNIRQQVVATAEAVRARFFDQDRIDGPLQRACLANLLRFYAGRSQRYGLLDDAAAAAFLSQLTLYEKSGADFRPRHEGFVVNLDAELSRPIVEGDLTVTVLTANDFEDVADFASVDINLQVSATNGAGVQLAHLASPVGPVTSVASSSLSDDNQSAAFEVAISDDRANRANTVSDVEAEAVGKEEPDTQATTESAGSPTVVAADADVPTISIQIVLGDGADGEVVWTPSVKGSPHLFITGIPGQGKSWTLLRLLTELGPQGVPALVFDFHGQFGAAGNPHLKAADPLVVDAASGLPFSPFECSEEAGPTDWKATAQAVSEIFAYVCGLGDIQRDTLYTCVRDVYRSYGFGSTEIDPPDGFPTLDDVQRAIEKAERQKRATNLVARCRPLLEMDVFKPPIGRQSDLLGALQRGLVVGFNRLSSEVLQQAAGAFLLRKLYRDMFAWGTVDRLRLVVVLDEAHRLARDVTLPLIMKEGRKFGIAVVVASQGLGDFHPDVLGNAGTKIAFRANYPDSRKVAGYFRGRPGQDLVARIESLAVGQALVQTADMAASTSVRMRPPES